MLLDFVILREVSGRDPSGDVIMEYLQDSVKFAKVLRLHARRLNLSLREFLRCVDINYSTFFTWAKGKHSINMLTAAKIDRHLKELEGNNIP